jgi:hypothetical protein
VDGLADMIVNAVLGVFEFIYSAIFLSMTEKTDSSILATLYTCGVIIGIIALCGLCVFCGSLYSSY